MAGICLRTLSIPGPPQAAASSLAGSVGERNLVEVNEEKIGGHVDAVVRSSVEETLNWLLEAVADELCGAKRSADRVDTCAGLYDRKLQTKAGEVTPKVPHPRNSQPFQISSRRAFSIPPQTG
jgi:transposase-like protein